MFGRFVLHWRLVRAFETLPERSATMIHWAVIAVDMGRRLIGESTQTCETMRSNRANHHPPGSDAL
jgi:hypothetical protein